MSNIALTDTIDVTFQQFGPCRFATLSHSYEAFGQQSTVSGNGKVNILNPGGSHFWLQAMLGPRFHAPMMITGKYGGNPLQRFIDEMPGFIAECKTQKVSDVLVIGLCNDTFSDLAAAMVVIGKLTTIAQGLTNAGLRLWITDDAPIGGSYIRSAGKLPAFGRVQEFIATELPRISSLITYVPIYNKLTLPGKTDGSPNPDLFDADLLHPNYTGHFIYAYEIFKLMRHFHQVPGSRVLSDVSYGYDAAINRRGNILANGMFNGDSGSGVATSWTLGGAPSGLTLVASKATDADGTPVQIITISGTPAAAGAAPEIRQDPSTGRFLQGDIHAASAFVLPKKGDGTLTGFTNLRGIEVKGSLSASSPAGNWTSQAGYSAGVGAGATKMWPANVDFSQFNDGKGLWLRGPDTEVTQAIATQTPFARFNVSAVLDAAVVSDVRLEIRQAEWKLPFAA